MKERTIDIAKEFSDMPLGRDEKDGPFHGGKFRREILTPALKQYDRVIVNMNDTMGYGSSFLDEAFAGLVRDDGFTVSELKKKLILIHDRTYFVNRAWTYIKEA